MATATTMSGFLGSMSPPFLDSNAIHCSTGSCPNGEIQYGVAYTQGRRASMEDTIEAQVSAGLHQGEQVALFGVYDGHGGKHVADYVRDNLTSNIMQNLETTNDLQKAVELGYEQTDSRLMNSKMGKSMDGGATAATALICGKQLLSANCGDTRVVLCHAGKAKQLSVDHKAGLESEKDRIHSLGGYVTMTGIWRVGGLLAVSRAFGNRTLKSWVTADPHVEAHTLCDDDEFLIIASDGLWDVLDNDEAVQEVRDEECPKAAAYKLLQQALKRNSSDNISIIVVRFPKYS